MKRVGGWLHTKPGQNGPSRSMTALDEQNALQEALASASLIMNDEMEQAEVELSKGTTPFHKIGRAVAIFLRAALGFEKEIMEAASVRIAEAEDAAAEYHRRAVRDPTTAHQSSIYPPGAEYALCHAECQLMSAVVAVLNESVTESLRGFYKLRKAFGTLSELAAVEKRYLEAHHIDPGKASSLVDSVAKTDIHHSNHVPGDSEDVPPYEEEEDELEFVDAKEVLLALVTPIGYDGHLEFPGFNSLTIHDSIDEPLHKNTAPGGEEIPAADDSTNKDVQQDVDFRTITSDSIDLFIHSGNALCFGLLQLLLSLIPPAFARILSIFSFRGNRENGFRLLWSATKFKHNINGAMAGLIVLGFHNGVIGFCDILSKNAMPETRLRSLLTEMRKIYPKSKLWLLEEARMLSRDRNLPAAVDIVANGPKSPLKQVEALGLFEVSLNLMHLHRYAECAKSFIDCVAINNWSHGLYYYIAGACHVELYRIHKTSDPARAKESAKKAEKYLLEVPLHTQKKRFMGRQLPFDVFTSRKISKWEARAKERGCAFVDAVGVSPLVEMVYFWNGPAKMQREQLQACLDRLAWSTDAMINPRWESEPVDEQCAMHVLRAACYRNMGEVEKAKTILASEVLVHDSHRVKGCDHADTWPLPVAHYEMAVCLWKEAGGEDGDRAVLQKCGDQVAKVERWESFELEARVGLKVTTARETLKKCGITTG